MNRIFLTSTIGTVKDLVKYIKEPLNTLTLAYIPTASELEEKEKGPRTWIKKDIQDLESLGFKVFEYTLTDKTQDNLKKDLDIADVLYVGGGNTYYLLQQIQLSGFTQVAKDHVDAGKVYIGTSAGAIVAGPDIEMAYRPDGLDSAPNLKSFKSINLLDFTVLPHWGSEMTKDLYLQHRLKHDYIPTHKTILLTNSQFIVYKDGWYKIEEGVFK